MLINPSLTICFFDNTVEILKVISREWCLSPLAPWIFESNQLRRRPVIHVLIYFSIFEDLQWQSEQSILSKAFVSLYQQLQECSGEFNTTSEIKYLHCQLQWGDAKFRYFHAVAGCPSMLTDTKENQRHWFVRIQSLFYSTKVNCAQDPAGPLTEMALYVMACVIQSRDRKLNPTIVIPKPLVLLSRKLDPWLCITLFCLKLTVPPPPPPPNLLWEGCGENCLIGHVSLTFKNCY